MEDPKIRNFKDWLELQKRLTTNRSLRESLENAKIEYMIIGKVTDLRIIQTKKGQWMAFSQLKDTKGYLDLVIFPKIWKQHGIYLRSSNIMGFSGIIDVSSENSKFLVRNVLRLDEIHEFHNSEVHRKRQRNNSKKNT